MNLPWLLYQVGWRPVFAAGSLAEFLQEVQKMRCVQKVYATFML